MPDVDSIPPIRNHNKNFPRIYQNTPKVPGTPIENTKNRRLPMSKGLEPLVLANTAGLLVAFGVFVQGAAAAGTFIVTTTTKQSLPPPAEEVLLLRLKESADVAAPIFPVESVPLADFEVVFTVEEVFSACAVLGAI
jgi:hypothetical protein